MGQRHGSAGPRWIGHDVGTTSMLSSLVE